MTRVLRSAGPITPRPWWSRALAAFGWALSVQVVSSLRLARTVPAPWNTGAPMALTIAVFFTYHSEWRTAPWRRATLVRLTGLVALGLLVVAIDYRLGWWR